MAGTVRKPGRGRTVESSVTAMPEKDAAGELRRRKPRARARRPGVGVDWRQQRERTDHRGRL